MNRHLYAIYLDWFNNFATVKGFADYYDISEEEAQLLINLSKRKYEEAYN